MPAKKPASLNTRNTSKQLRAERIAAESALTPRTGLTKAVPNRLRGAAHAVAAATWKRMIGLYLEVEGGLVTAFDENILERYCKMFQECIEQEALYVEVKKDYEDIRRKAKVSKGEEVSKLWETTNKIGTRLQAIDARLDGKRKELHKLEQSLYLTPRSRAGVAPAEKETDSAVDPMDALLNS